MPDDLRARMQLRDGRVVWRDGRGCLRDAATGRFVRREVVEGLVDETEQEDELLPLALRAFQAARARLLEIVRGRGHTAESAEDAWARLVGVQAEIALDSENGSKATTAAKLVAQATGMLEQPEAEEEAGAGRTSEEYLLGRELTRQLVALVEQERARRGWDGE